MNTPFLLVTVLPPMPIWILMTTLHVTLDLLAPGLEGVDELTSEEGFQLLH